MTQEHCNVVTELTGDVAVLTIEGDLTAAAEVHVEESFAAALTAGAGRLVISFREDDHINSAGVGILIGLVMQARERGTPMRFAQPSSHFRRIFEIVGLTRYVDVFPGVDEALDQFAQ